MFVGRDEAADDWLLQVCSLVELLIFWHVNQHGTFIEERHYDFNGKEACNLVFFTRLLLLGFLFEIRLHVCNVKLFM